jgi:hypothetical protein
MFLTKENIHILLSVVDRSNVTDNITEIVKPRVIPEM